MKNYMIRSIILVLVTLIFVGCNSNDELMNILYNNTVYFDDFGLAGNSIEAFKFNYQYKINRKILGSGIPVIKTINSEIISIKNNEITFSEIDENTLKTKECKLLLNKEGKIEIVVEGKKYIETKRVGKK
jgi:hypothetical protein